jgi:hypothetical protein
LDEEKRRENTFVSIVICQSYWFLLLHSAVIVEEIEEGEQKKKEFSVLNSFLKTFFNIKHTSNHPHPINDCAHAHHDDGDDDHHLHACPLEE